LAFALIAARTAALATVLVAPLIGARLGVWGRSPVARWLGRHGSALVAHRGAIRGVGAGAPASTAAPAPPPPRLAVGVESAVTFAGWAFGTLIGVVRMTPIGVRGGCPFTRGEFHRAVGFVERRLLAGAFASALHTR